MSAHADAHAAHPPVAHQSSRVDAPTLGMLLFIASEVMLFGSFFTAYFFVRVVNGIDWPPAERSVGSDQHSQEDDGGHVLPATGNDVHPT